MFTGETPVGDMYAWLSSPRLFYCFTLSRRYLLTKHGAVCLSTLFTLRETRSALYTDFSIHVKSNVQRANKVTKQNNVHFYSDPFICMNTFILLMAFFFDKL